MYRKANSMSMYAKKNKHNVYYALDQYNQITKHLPKNVNIKGVCIVISKLLEWGSNLVFAIFYFWGVEGWVKKNIVWSAQNDQLAKIW